MLRTISYTISCVLCYRFRHVCIGIFKAYRFKYNCIFTKVRVYHRTHLIKKQIIKYGNILLGVHFNLRYSKFKSDYSKVIKSAYVMGVVQNHFYHSVKR